MNKPIETENICPPIPSRKYDWQANRKDWDLGEPIGTGKTELEAITDLLEKEQK